MSKKIAKILAGITAVGAVAAGVYYWFQKKADSDFEDEFNEEFDAADFELDEDLKDVSDRGYTTLTPSTEEVVEETPVVEEETVAEETTEEEKAE